MPTAEPTEDEPDLIATTDGRVPGRRGLATRQRLLECTAELLVATPWRSIKVIDIARQAGTSPATFYQYFENVEAAITVLAEELVEGAGVLGEMVDGDWSDDASWDTAVAVVEGFMDYWERNRAVFRVVELTTVEGDLRFQGLRVRALNSVTVTLARVIANHAGTLGIARRRRPDGRGRDAGGHAGPGGRPPLRLRVLGHPHGVPEKCGARRSERTSLPMPLSWPPTSGEIAAPSPRQTSWTEMLRHTGQQMMKSPHPNYGLNFRSAVTFSVIRLREALRLGQRVASFEIDVRSGNAWRTLAAAKSIGNCRLFRTAAPVTTDNVRLRITSSPVCPALSDFGLFAE